MAKGKKKGGGKKAGGKKALSVEATPQTDALNNIRAAAREMKADLERERAYVNEFQQQEVSILGNNIKYNNHWCVTVKSTILLDNGEKTP